MPPLMNTGSKKAFKENLKSELNAGKPKDQSLAIAYEVQRKNRRKKMAKGGMVKDSGMGLMEREDEKEMIASMPPDGYGKQPKASYDEMAQKVTSGSPDMQKQHNNGRAPYYEGGEVDANSITAEEMKMIKNHRMKMANGGMVPKDNGVELTERDDEAHLMSSAEPASPKMQPKSAYDESHDYGMRSGDPDDDRQHSNGRRAYKDGGMIDDEDMSDERHMSTAEKILNRKAKSGEQAFIELNGKESPNDYYKQNEEYALDENLDKDMFDSKQPEDSNMHGDDLKDEDSHDMVESIRRKIKMKRGM